MRIKFGNKLAVLTLLLGLATTGLLAETDFTATGTPIQNDDVSVSIISPTASIGVGENVNFLVDVDPESDPACSLQSWILNFGDGGSRRGFSSSIASHRYNAIGTFNVELFYTFFENVGTAMTPDCQPRTRTDSLQISVVDTVSFTGSDSNWFNPNSWSNGQLPARNDNVRINNTRVVIDPAHDASASTRGVVFVADLALTGSALLETFPGTELHFQNCSVVDNSSINAVSSLLLGTGAISLQGRSLTLSSSLLQSLSVNLTDTEVEILLGGSTPAGPQGVGPGHYGNIRGDTISLSNVSLQVVFVHNFAPQPGDQFVIVQSGSSLSGQFNNASEGAEVARVGNVSLVIRYVASSIVLEAQAVN